jgi:dienelactone hydrolase
MWQSYVEKEDVQGLQIPFFVGLAEKDTWVPVSLAESLHYWVGPRKDQNDHLEIEIFPGVGHGFAARPDTQDRVIFEQYQIAMAKATAFLDKYSK